MSWFNLQEDRQAWNSIILKYPRLPADFVSIFPLKFWSKFVFKVDCIVFELFWSLLLFNYLYKFILQLGPGSLSLSLPPSLHTLFIIVVVIRLIFNWYLIIMKRKMQHLWFLRIYRKQNEGFSLITRNKNRIWSLWPWDAVIPVKSPRMRIIFKKICQLFSMCFNSIRIIR